MKHTILKAFTKKNSLRNLTRFHDGLFDLELLEISTKVLSLKRIKKSSQKDASDLKIAWHRKKQKKKLKNEEKN